MNLQIRKFKLYIFIIHEFEIKENSFQIDILKDKIKLEMIIVNQFVKFVTK